MAACFVENMKKEGVRVYNVKKSNKGRRFVEALISVPYAFWVIYFYENGFNWLVAVLAIILFIIIPGVLSVFWKEL